MNINDALLEAIRIRQKQAEFNSGIITADRYVQTIRECIGADECYKFACKGNISFDDAITKAAKTLTYNNDEMVLQSIYADWKAIDYRDSDGDALEMPKNTLMAFSHVLTSPKKDRDGDIMRTQGARPDPKMLLLWQHTATLPIGKLLQIAEHNAKRMVVVSAIVDMNALCHDAAVMVDNKMGRFSHGFRALEFEKMKSENGMDSGFDVKSFEVMEESLVSIPSNTDAETLGIIVGLTEGGKLTSPLMKSVGKSLREKHIPQQVAVSIDVSKLKKEEANGGTIPTTTEKSACIKSEGCQCGCSSKETNIPTGSEKRTDEKEIVLDEKSKTTSHDQGVTMSRQAMDASRTAFGADNSNAAVAWNHAVNGNHGNAADYHREAARDHQYAANDCSRFSFKPDGETIQPDYGAATQHVQAAQLHLQAAAAHTVLSGKDTLINKKEETDLDLKQMMVDFLASAKFDDRQRMKSAIDALDQVEVRTQNTKAFKALI